MWRGIGSIDSWVAFIDVSCLQASGAMVMFVQEGFLGAYDPVQHIISYNLTSYQRLASPIITQLIGLRRSSSTTSDRHPIFLSLFEGCLQT